MFVLMTTPDGKRMLLNLDLMFAVQEGPKGEAIAISTGGAAVPCVETFDFVANDLIGGEQEE